MKNDKNLKNIAASVKEKLKNISKDFNKDYQTIFKQYVHERFLYRLSKSLYSENFFLKGALLLLAHDVSRDRPTKDIDLLCKDLENDLEEIKTQFKNILAISCDDGLEFEIDNLEGNYITENNKYNGIRIKTNVYLENAKDRIQIDIGFGDIIHKGPVLIDYPVLLDMPVPKIFAYSLETSIAEKFEAIVSLGLTTSRMKDFYDIYFVASNNSFYSDDIFTALKTTFSNRKTNLEDRTDIYAHSFSLDKNKKIQWEAFLKKSNIKVKLNFTDIITKIDGFIEPTFTHRAKRKWNTQKWIWE